jgi:hypothetical protein
MPTLRERRHLSDDARAVKPAVGNAGSAPSARQALLRRDHQITADRRVGLRQWPYRVRRSAAGAFGAGCVLRSCQAVVGGNPAR